MKTKKLLIVGAVVLLAVLAIVFGLWHKSASAPDTTNTDQKSVTNTTNSQVTATQADDTTQAVATITYSNNGFAPAEITVKSGDTVEIKNTSNHTMDFDSDPHPVHTDDADLNVGTIKSGETKKFTLTKQGTWGYHNHLNPSETGTVHVQ